MGGIFSFFRLGDVIDRRRLGRLGPIGVGGFFIVFKDFVGDIAAHLGVHSHLRKILLEFFIHRRINFR